MAHAPSRREFLALMAAAMPLPPLRRSSGQAVERLQRRGPSQRVIVLGAGLAGLSSAYELQNLGHTVLVLEAQSRPGGRVRTLREAFAPGLYTEAGAESIPAAHDLTQHYAREFGLRLLPDAVPGTRGFYYVRGQRVSPNDAAVWPLDLTADERTLGLAGLFRKFVDEAEEQALAAGYARQPVRALSAWDPYTARAWLRSRGASPAAAELITLGYGTELSGSVPHSRLEFTRFGDQLPHRRRQRPLAEGILEAGERPLWSACRGRDAGRQRRFGDNPHQQWN